MVSTHDGKTVQFMYCFPYYGPLKLSVLLKKA